METSILGRSARRRKDHFVSPLLNTIPVLRLTSLQRSVNKESSQVELSLRKSASVKKAQLSLDDVSAGQVVKGVVSRVEAYGAFIRLDGSNISGLCHKSNVSLPSSSSIYSTLIRCS